MYKVLDVARFAINCAERDGQPLSNLKLQKILYFLWKRFYAKNKASLFKDDYFFAWKFGPVVPSVYYEYFMFGAYPIAAGLLDDFDEEVLPEDARSFIAETVRDYEGQKVGELIKRTHVEGGAWYRVFANGKGMKEIIPFLEIQKDIENEQAEIYS